VSETWRCYSKGVHALTYSQAWFVENKHVASKRTTEWGPFDTEEEAMRVSGMPRPKTEAEELWELVDLLSGKITEYVGGYIPHFTKENALTKIAELKTKWKK